MCSREPSKQHILAALVRSLDRRWFLAGGSLPLGALVRSAAMAAHPSKYGHVNAAQFLKLLPTGGSNRRYSKEDEFVIHNIDRKLAGQDEYSWFGAVRDQLGSGQSAPAIGCDEQDKLSTLLESSLDPNTGYVNVPYEILMDWNATVGKYDCKHLAEKGWCHLQTLTGLARAAFDVCVDQHARVLSSMDADVSTQPIQSSLHTITRGKSLRDCLYAGCSGVLAARGQHDDPGYGRGRGVDLARHPGAAPWFRGEPHTGLGAG